jgi:hypothetical protein
MGGYPIEIILIEIILDSVDEKYILKDTLPYCRGISRLKTNQLPITEGG